MPGTAVPVLDCFEYVLVPGTAVEYAAAVFRYSDVKCSEIFFWEMMSSRQVLLPIIIRSIYVLVGMVLI